MLWNDSAISRYSDPIILIDVFGKSIISETATDRTAETTSGNLFKLHLPFKFLEISSSILIFLSQKLLKILKKKLLLIFLFLFVFQNQ